MLYSTSITLEFKIAGSRALSRDQISYPLRCHLRPYLGREEVGKCLSNQQEHARWYLLVSMLLFSLSLGLRPFAKRSSFSSKYSLCSFEKPSELPENECTHKLRNVLDFSPAPRVPHPGGLAQVVHPSQSYLQQSWWAPDCNGCQRPVVLSVLPQFCIRNHRSSKDLSQCHVHPAYKLR